MDIRVMGDDAATIEAALARLQEQQNRIGAVVCAGDIISADSQDGFLR